MKIDVLQTWIDRDASDEVIAETRVSVECDPSEIDEALTSIARFNPSSPDEARPMVYLLSSPTYKDGDIIGIFSTAKAAADWALNATPPVNDPEINEWAIDA
jgi:hypothetical protein